MKALLLVLVIGALAQEDLLRQLAKQDFAKSILQTITIEIGQSENGGNPAKKIYAMLNQIFYDLRDEDAASSKANGARQADCSSSLAQINDIQERALVALADYERQVPGRQEELNDKREQLEEKAEEIERNQDQIVNFGKKRQAEHDEYEEKRDSLIAMINGLKQAQQIIRQLQTSHPGGALVELRQHHQNLMKTYANKSEFKLLSSLLLELCADAKIHSDNDSVQVILDIIDDLVESIYDVQKREMYTEDWAQKFYEEDFKRLQLEVTRLVNANIQDQAQVEFVQQRLEDLKQQISLQQMIYDNKEEERKHLNASCDDDAKSAEAQRESRQEQIAVVLQLLELFENNFNDNIRAVLLELFP